jgi:hypothetical protein
MCLQGRKKSLVADDSGVAGAVESAGGDMDPVVIGDYSQNPTRIEQSGLGAKSLPESTKGP